MKGILKAKSIQTYGLFDKGKELYSFSVPDPRKRKGIDPLQGKIVSQEEIKKLI